MGYSEQMYYRISETNKLAMSYIKANNFLKKLRGMEDRLTLEQYRELKQIAMSGNIDAAEDKLWTIIRRREEDAEHKAAKA